MSDGQAHNAYPLPFSLVGSAGGRLKGNRFIVARSGRRSPMRPAVADIFGTPLEKFGEHGPAAVRMKSQIPMTKSRIPNGGFGASDLGSGPPRRS